jgi:hypothetical protein
MPTWHNTASPAARPSACASGSSSSPIRRLHRWHVIEDFLAVSKALSRAPNAASGGLLGWVEPGQLPPEFEAAVFGLNVGELSDPVPSNAGWHVFQVMERHAAGAPPDTSVRDHVRGQLAAEAAEAARRSCLRRLATRVGVRVDCAGVSFPCTNPFEGDK